MDHWFEPVADHLGAAYLRYSFTKGTKQEVEFLVAALDLLGNPELSASPLPSGHGTVSSAHGELEVPVPAVRSIARRRGIPLVPVPVRGETVTPTGVAVLAALCTSFIEVPAGAAALGVGAGSRRFPDRPNVVRVHGYRT